MLVPLHSMLNALPEDARRELAQRAADNGRTVAAEAEALAQAHLGGATLAEVVAEVIASALREGAGSAESWREGSARCVAAGA